MKELIEEYLENIPPHLMDKRYKALLISGNEVKQIIEALEFYEKCKRVQPFDQLTK